MSRNARIPNRLLEVADIGSGAPWEWRSGSRFFFGKIFCGEKFRRRSKFRDNYVAENNPTFAYTIITFNGIHVLPRSKPYKNTSFQFPPLYKELINLS